MKEAVEQERPAHQHCELENTQHCTTMKVFLLVLVLVLTSSKAAPTSGDGDDDAQSGFL